jgi:hypothetical protein
VLLKICQHSPVLVKIGQHELLHSFLLAEVGIPRLLWLPWLLCLVWLPWLSGESPDRHTTMWVNPPWWRSHPAREAPTQRSLTQDSSDVVKSQNVQFWRPHLNCIHSLTSFFVLTAHASRICEQVMNWIPREQKSRTTSLAYDPS